MNNILKQIKQLREEAETLVDSGACLEWDEAPSRGDEKESCLKCGGVNWLANLRDKAGKWKGKPLVVLSLFDGIGGVWAALENLGIPFTGYSCEVCDDAIKVTKQNHSKVRHLGDIQKLKRGDIKEKVDLVVGGFPCQDLTCLGRKMGLHGSRSRLFFDMLRVIKTFTPTWFLAENVASMTWIDREEISKHLGTTPIEIDAQTFTPCKRRRLYWTNLPHPKISPRITESEGTSIQSVIHNGTALARKNSCVVSVNSSGGAGKCDMELVYDPSRDKTRYINVVEVELMMGYPPHYTSVGCVGHPSAKPGITGRSTRWRLLGNTFSVPVITYLLSCLREPDVREHTRKYHLPASVREEDCSVMAPGEIWAMYNSEQRPNWYALIVSRSGGRFDANGYEPGMKSSRLPLHIEVKFLELTKPYEAGEKNLWSTVRGTGLYCLAETTQVQGSWVSFSHQVTNMISSDDKHYFIYPGKDEVWSVYDSGTESRYLVYVLESSVNKQNAKKGLTGKEAFSARCRLLQKKIEFDLYAIVDKEITYTDLRVFSFRAPYHFLNERNTLKIELSVKHRDRGAHSDKLKRKRSHRRSESDDDDLFDMELEEDVEGDDPVEI